MGSDYQEFDLPDAQKWAVGRDSIHAISIKNNQVSSKHAELAMAADGVKLTALKTTNGTFVGEDKHPIAPGQSKLLRFGEVFWIGPNIKLKVEQR
jgi:pSer/pThr/pTyr-binding forkhead associated (FHA) protein